MTNPNNSEQRLVRASEAAAKLGVHPRTLRRWSDRGIIPQPIRQGPGGYRYYLVRDVEALLTNGATT
jgi:DNA-binding transcriptional MerR regulator